MKLAVVAQRYGADISGGAELHARYVAERLARHAQVEVVTTCARDYVSWRNELEPGVETVNGLPVRRFPVIRERHPLEFGRQSHRVFDEPHSLADELSWLESEGPASPALIDYLVRSASSFDYILLFSYRYYHAWHAARRLPGKAVLVPTAERDSTIGLAMFGPVFRGVRGIMYNSHEERAMIQNATHNQHVPGVVVGVGSEVPDRTDPGPFPATAQDQPAVCDLHRTRRCQQGVRRALRLLPALRDDVHARPRSRASWARRSCRSRSTTGFTTSGICRTRTSSTRSPPPTS